jgi:hypothetical protein
MSSHFLDRDSPLFISEWYNPTFVLISDGLVSNATLLKNSRT